MFDASWLALAAAAIPLLAALAVRMRPDPPRGLVAGAAALALALSAAATNLDSLSRLAMVLYSGIAFMALLAAPKRDRTPAESLEALVILGGTLSVFATGNLLVLLAGWVLSAIPFWRRHEAATGSWMLPRLTLAGGTVALGAAIARMAWQASQAGSADAFSLATLRNLRAIDDPWIFALLIAAVLTRKSVVPLHSALLKACERGSLINTMLFMNGHLGVYLLARLALPLMPSASHDALSPLADVALLSAACTALMALTEKSARRLLGLLSISQMSFLLAGLESSNEAGVNGAMVYLVVLSFATSVLFVVLRLLEVRLGGPLTLDRFHGLAGRTPRLAAFFLLSALALVGLPGTLGFIAEDLLFHGTLESHPELGLILPVATALNAVSLLRMFSFLFFGRRTLQVPHVMDAKPAERLALTMAAVLVVVLGLQPELLLAMTRSAVDGLVR